MGLASALSTALTGLTAAETQIDAVGNNLANSQTVGFKSSDVVFSTQFLQTLSLGSAPTSASGGTNPRQTGLGVQVAAVTPDFTQGTIEVSANPSDLAIQGDGFFMVEGSSGDTLFTRNGIFQTNANNELVTVAGQRLLGFGIDEFFSIKTTQLVPLSIPLGSAAVAQATQNVFLEGTLSPTGDLADTAEVIESAILGDDLIPRPDITNAAVATPATSAVVASTPDLTAVTDARVAGASGLVLNDQYEYQVTFLDASGAESLPSIAPHAVTISANNEDVTLNNLPATPAGTDYSNLNIYRRKVGVAAGDPEFDFKLIGATAAGASFTDQNTVVGTGAVLDQTTLDGNYSYLVTFSGAGVPESRPSALLGPINVVNGRVHLNNLPAIPTGPGIPAYTTVNVYRNLATDSSRYFRTAQLAPGVGFTDNRADAVISDPTNPANLEIDLDGPKISSATFLTNVLTRDGLNFTKAFETGTLSFAARKGGRTLDDKPFTIVQDQTTVGDLLQFMNDAMGIQTSPSGDPNPIPGSVNLLGSGPSTLSAGGSVSSAGKIRFVSNNGVDNALSIGLSAFQLTSTAQQVLNPNLGFGSIQTAVGQSAVTDFVVFDSLGSTIDVRLTAILESRSGTATTYRWFADSADNDPAGAEADGNVAIAVGTGLISFDGEGNLISSSNLTINIDRRDTPAVSPLGFDLDVSQLSGLAADQSTVAASRQDGSSAGKLTSFIIGEDGVIRGVFNNGVTRNLGQIRLARFNNTIGLEQRGQNLYASGVNSGLPIIGDAGADGIGAIIAGAVELSNTDVGRNLIDLVLATTQFRGNSRVISTAQQLFDELLNLRR